MKMFSGSDDDDQVESTGYESYGEPGYSSPFAHWLEDDTIEYIDTLNEAYKTTKESITGNFK